MSSLPPLAPTPELTGPRFAIDRRMCVAANRWGARRAVGIFFGAVSRLGDGVFWYALMLSLVLFDGRRGMLAAAHMAAALATDAPAPRDGRRAAGQELAHGLATADWLAADLGQAPRARDGRLHLPAGPGLGFRPDA